MFALS
jgi:hypothetical protein